MNKLLVNGIEVYKFNKLISHANLLHLVSTRKGGISKPPYNELNFAFHVGDNIDDVITNRKRLMNAVNVPLESIVTCRQSHGNNIAIVDSSMKGKGALSDNSALPNTDALITNEPEICLVVMVADCVPILLFDREKEVVAVAHSGWKGTVLKLTLKTINTMINVFKSNPEDIIACIGPSIGPHNYEVGSEVIQQAKMVFPNENVVLETTKGKGLFDLWAANLSQLLYAGIPPNNIEIAKISTFLNTNTFFSDRRERPTGRFIAALMIKNRQ